MKKAIVIGSGAGGATVAKELQGHFDVTVLEAGREFKPLGLKIQQLERLRQFGLLFDERVTRFVFPSYSTRRIPNQMVLVKGVGLGGTTTLCTGNGLRMDGDLKALGIDLDPEFEEVYREIHVTTAHQAKWREPTRRLFEIFRQMGLNPEPTPKMGEYERCMHCGRCQLGCPSGAKWDSRRFLDVARGNGAQVITGCSVDRLIIEDGHATGVRAWIGLTRRFFPADLIVLAAGGFGTPVILDNSGLACEPRLSVDPVLSVAARMPKSMHHKEVAMPFVSARDHIILSPYFDDFSFLFDRRWRMPASDIVSIMIKLADDNLGSISSRGVDKALTSQDQRRLDEGVDLCREILQRYGAQRQDMFLGTVIAGHPGGMLPLTQKEAVSFHSARLPENVYVADGTLLPRSLGNPPILTIIAMAKRVSKICISR